MTGDAPNRRNPQQADRRRLLARPGGRRETDSEPSHGTRASYQHGCRCTPCRAANAAYMSDLRTRRAKGVPILGALISAAEAWRGIRQLRGEDFPHQRITGRRADRHPFIRTYAPDLRIRLRTAVRIAELRRFHWLDETGDAGL